MKINYKQNKERVRIIIEAIGCSSLDAAAEKLYRMFKNVGVPNYLSKCSLHISTITTLNATFIAPGRAENNIVNVGQENAIEILRIALSSLMKKTKKTT